MSVNIPALWRFTKFDNFAFPITAVSATPGTKQVLRELKKILTDDSATLSRLLVHIVGPVVIAGAGAGAASGADNPGSFLVSANLTSSPVYANCVPINQVSSRGLRADGIVNAGVITEDDPQAWGGSTVIADAAGTVQVDLWTVLNFKRSPGNVRQGIEYGLPLSKYTSLLLSLQFGSRDQMFTGGTNTWDASGLTVELYADLDLAVSPEYIHAHELFENNYPVTATTKDFKLNDLPSGFEYTDLYIITENAGAPVDGILNNVSIKQGGQTWFEKGEGNAAAIRYAFLERNNRLATSLIKRATVPGLFPIPLKDRMFTRGFDARYSPLTVSLDVTSLSATSNIRLVGRRMLPGGIYSKAKK